MPSSADAKPHFTPAQVLEDISHFSPTQLEKVIRGAAALQLEKRRVVSPKRESELLRAINRGLNEKKEADLQKLQEKLRNETISDAERGRLIRLTEEIEALAARRMQALLELAALRKKTPRNLIQEFGFDQSAYVWPA